MVAQVAAGGRTLYMRLTFCSASRAASSSAGSFEPMAPSFDLREVEAGSGASTSVSAELEKARSDNSGVTVARPRTRSFGCQAGEQICSPPPERRLRTSGQICPEVPKQLQIKG